eukprot:TRINITY_DN4434_c0_g1_i3.p1 TRINITY_DN4434_c0_g1~~TRINITY_DN4434_c0_g1_i3.p1  ORF type:complete len:148 (-),score=49.69 TRINITY_DN4434_c0_g1_i3:352-795(-)
MEFRLETSGNTRRLVVAEKGLTALPDDFGDQFGPVATHLDLSFNAITRVNNLDKFAQLVSLVLDNNQLGNINDFPSMPSLQTLSVNNNNIDDLDLFLDSFVDKFPNLTFLSMIKNPACPLLSDDDTAYTNYRYAPRSVKRDSFAPRK